MGQFQLFDDEFFHGTIDLTFFGNATKEHTMDLKWYAQSLMGFNESFTRVNRSLFNLDVGIEIVAEDKGSIVARLKYCGKVGVYALGLYASLITVDAYHGYKMSTAIGSSYVHIIDVFKSSKGDKDVLKKIILESDLSYKEKDRLIALIENLDFRLALDDMTLFLEQNGLDKVSIDYGGGVSTTITKYDRPYFKIHPDDFKKKETISDILTVVAIGNAEEWKFNGSEFKRPFSALISDRDFLKEIKQHSAASIFKMKLKADIVKTTKIKAGNRKPSRPTYEIKSLSVITEESLPLPLK